MDLELKKKLCEMAINARELSYSPYSDFAVGAALLCRDGEIYTGVNIENAAFSPTNCAERTAFFKAISEGKKDFSAIAVAGGKNGQELDFCYPCGVCRQVIAEFCSEDFLVISARSKEEFKERKFHALMPYSFSPDDLR